MMGFAVILGELITLKGNLLLLPSFLGFITAFTLTGSSMSLNDYFDRWVDAVNEPTRPIPSGLVKAWEALLYAFILAFVGLFSAVILGLNLQFLGFAVPTVAGLSFLLSVYYNAKGKTYGFLGNLMVSGCVAVPFIYGAFMVGFVPPPILLIFASMAFLSNTGREIIKGIADVEGDKIRNIQTLAIRLNLKKAAYVAMVFYMLAVGFIVLPPILGMVSFWYLPFIAVASSGFLVTAYLTIKNVSPENAKKMKKWSLVWMFFGLLAFMFGSLT